MQNFLSIIFNSIISPFSFRQSVDLSEHGVSLKPGVIYQWSVALVGQPEKRSSDIVSSGTIGITGTEIIERGRDTINRKLQDILDIFP